MGLTTSLMDSGEYRVPGRRVPPANRRIAPISCTPALVENRVIPRPVVRHPYALEWIGQTRYTNMRAECIILGPAAIDPRASQVGSTHVSCLRCHAEAGSGRSHASSRSHNRYRLNRSRSVGRDVPETTRRLCVLDSAAGSGVGLWAGRAVLLAGVIQRRPPSPLGARCCYGMM